MKKNLKPPQFIRTPSPFRGKGKHVRVWFLEEQESLPRFFWDLIRSIIKLARDMLGKRKLGFIPSSAKPLATLYKWFRKTHWINIRIRWVLVGLLIWALWPSSGKTIYADPMAPAPKVVKITMAASLPQSPLQPVEPVAPIVQPPAPAPAPVASGGCVTGVTSGNYALNQLIQHESSGDSCNTNGGGCFGLLQACPGYPLRVACGGDVTCQLNWFAANKLGRYGSWEVAWVFWQRTDCRPYCGHWW